MFGLTWLFHPCYYSLSFLLRSCDLLHFHQGGVAYVTFDVWLTFSCVPVHRVLPAAPQRARCGDSIGEVTLERKVLVSGDEGAVSERRVKRFEFMHSSWDLSPYISLTQSLGHSQIWHLTTPHHLPTFSDERISVPLQKKTKKTGEEYSASWIPHLAGLVVPMSSLDVSLFRSKSRLTASQNFR